MAEQIAGGVRRARYLALGKKRARHALEWSIETVQHSVELDAHLERERPAGAVIWRRRRRTGIPTVIGVILRLEHVEDVRTKGLRRLHDKRSGRIRPRTHDEWRRGPQDLDPVLQQRIDEPYGSRKIGLVVWQDEGAWVAKLRVPCARSRDPCRRSPGIAAAPLDRVLPHP